MTFTSNIIALHPVSRCRMPELIPGGIDDVLERRWDAELMAERIVKETEKPYRLASLQLDFSRRLDAIVLRRNAE